MKSEIVLPAAELKEAVSGLSKVINRSARLPVLQHVRVSRDQKGSVSLQTTDLDSFVTYHTETDQPGELVDVLIPIEQLNKAVKSSSSKESVTLLVDGKEKIKLRYAIAGHKVEQVVTGLPVKEWPPTPKIDQAGIVLEKEFGSALKQALECASDDSTRYAIQGACLDVTDKKYHYVVGTNGQILFSANSFCFDLKKSVTIPNSKFLSATDFLEQEGCLLSVNAAKGNRTCIKLESPRWTYISKQIDAVFPNWKGVVPLTGRKVNNVILNEPAIKQMLAVTARLPGDQEDNAPVRLRIEGNALFIAGRNKDEKEWTSICIGEAVVKGSNVKVSVNREYLIKALRFGLKQVEITDALSPIVFWNAGRRLIVMPLRPDNATAVPAPRSASPVPDQQQATPSPTNETKPERTTMPRTVNRAIEPVNGEPEKQTGLKSLADKVDQLRETLKNVQRDLIEISDGLKLAEKEQRTTGKEIEGFRKSLQKIQSFSI
jgi:DNA polymerase III sliding clamp (beta) subunit (PCNA family)